MSKLAENNIAKSESSVSELIKMGRKRYGAFVSTKASRRGYNESLKSQKLAESHRNATCSRNMLFAPEGFNGTRRSPRCQSINSSSTIGADSSTPMTDGKSLPKRMTVKPAMSEYVPSPRRSLRCKVIPNYNETNLQKHTRQRLGVKRKAFDEVERESSQRKKIHKDNDNSQDGKRHRNKAISDEDLERERSAFEEDGAKESVDEDKSEINRLPLEVLGHIFKLLQSRDRKRARLVCKKWYDNCQNERIKVKRRCKDEKMLDIRRCLKNCKFKRLNLSFEGVSVNKLPVTLWRKIGRKVQSLECQLATKTMKNIVLFCSNLQHLYLSVSPGLADGVSNSLTTLEELENGNVVNRKLQTLEINLRDEVVHLSDYGFDKWRRLFEVIYRIFPNITNFAFSRYHFRSDGSIKYKCKFSRAYFTYNQVEDSSLAPVFANLAFSIFSGDDWVKSLETLSTLRLINFELIFCKKMYTNEDRIHLRNFIASQKHLRSIRVDFSSWVGAEMLSSVLFGIVENCFDLDELSYNVPYHKHYLAPSECTALLQKMAHVKSVSIGGFSITSSPVFSVTSPTFKVSKLELSSVDEKICRCFIRNYTCLQHLILKKFITDDVLQSIFQYLTELKTLDVQLDAACTNFGITGRPNVIETSSSTPGYSISRLQSLKQLTINLEKAEFVDDRVFLDFNLPKLLYLHCTKDPIKSRYVVALAPRLPLLEEIRFKSADMSLESLQKFCKRSTNLYHLQTNVDSFVNKLGRIFDVCPRLRMITNLTSSLVYYYSTTSRKVVRRNSP